MIFASGLALAACGTASFSGGGSSGRTGTNNVGPGGSNSPSAGTGGTNPAGTNSSGNPVNPGGSSNPGSNPGSSQNTTANTIQTIGGIINTIRNNIDVTRTDREIVFGGDKVFHIGDGRYPASTCQRQINAYPLSGTKYFFEFEVLEDSTLVDIDVLTVCGVDYSDSNAIDLVNSSGQYVDTRMIRAGSLSTGLNSRTLNKGRYSVLVESRRNTTAGVEGGDNDDFIVGKIRVRSSRNIKPGDVRVQ